MSTHTGTLAIGLAALTLASATSTALAQTDPWNRKLGEVYFVPSQNPALGDSFFDIWVDITVLVEPATFPRDLSTEVEFVLNGSTIDIELVALNLDGGGTNVCGLGGCGGGCGGGYIDGVFNTMLCLDESGPGQPPDCGCGFPWITLGTPDVPLEPGDEIMVILRPAPGALPDNDTTDNIKRATFEDEPRYHHRRIRSVGLQPSTVGGDSFFDIIVDIEFEANGLASTVDLSSEVEILVNGNTAMNIPIQNRYAPSGGYCSAFNCGGGCGVVESLGVDCGSGMISGCACQWGFTANGTIPAEPGDIVAVILKPAPGALPTLPGFPDDSRETVPVPGCPGDANGDNLVDITDLNLVLGNFGTNGPAGDVNSDNSVDITDLNLVLGNFGTNCAPV